MIERRKLFFILIFSALLLILRKAGVIEISINTIVNYIIIFYGLSLVYNSFAKNKLQLFVGSVLFLTGVAFFIVNDFDFSDVWQIVLPSAIIIIGLSCLMLYLSNRNDTSFLIIGGLFFSAGVIVIFVTGHLSFDKYFASVIEVAADYWLILIILIIVILFSKRIGKT
jgi:hypothetical protein